MRKLLFLGVLVLTLLVGVTVVQANSSPALGPAAGLGVAPDLVLGMAMFQDGGSGEDRPAELSEAVQDYQRQVLRVTEAVAQDKRGQVNPQGLRDLRERGLAIINRGNLTKAMVKNQLDPIYTQLHDALVPSLEELYAADDELQAARQALLDAGEDEAKLVRIERVSAGYAICERRQHERILADNLGLSSELSPLEREAMDCCNLRRLIMGLNPLRIDMKLVACGRDHSKDMHERKFFAHDSPVPGKRRFTQRAQNFDTTASAENIAKGQRHGHGVDNSWWHSPGHLKNMMRPTHTRFGVGRHERLWTQMFGS